MPKKSKQSKQNKSMVSVTNQILRTVQVDNSIYKKRLVLIGAISSNALGEIGAAITMDPSSSTDWASCSGLYDEFRVVGCRITIVPRQQFSLTVLSNIVAVTFDNDSSALHTSLNAAAEYQNVRFIPSVWTGPERKFSFTRPNSGGSSAIEWRDIGAPATSLGSVQFTAGPLSTTTAYFTYCMEYAVEFRGIR